MLGVLLTILFAFGAEGVGSVVLKRWTAGLDPALVVGVNGIGGLAIMGLLTLPIALLPGGTQWGVIVAGAVALAGWYPLIRYFPRFKQPSGLSMLFPLAALLTLACSAVGVLAPSDSLDWDTLAYHLAAPKIWLHDGQLHYISFIHQSNFPLTVDGLYIWGLAWGGQAGAKAFSLMFAAYGTMALFGFGRSRFGQVGGWWSMLAYLSIPMVAWEAGTGYIDVSNGLFVALGILFAAQFATDTGDQNPLWLSAIFLGFAAGSKYTGLQTIFAVATVLVIAAALSPGLRTPEEKQDITQRRKERQGPGIDLSLVRGALLAALAALAIASPWYVRNVVNTGNPVFPFFYSVFKGRNWDAFSDRIYRNQQQIFGAGRAEETPEHSYTSGGLEPSRIGAAVLGLAYQPGRYADPAPTQGMGLPFVALGAIPLAGLLCWMFSGRMGRFAGVVAGTVLFSLTMWFVLSEQSRYILGLAFALCVLAGGAVSQLKIGKVLAAATVLQLLVGLFVLTRYGDEFSDKLRVVMGTDSPEDYQKQHISFYGPAQDLNEAAKDGRVALYDEVFGFFLDVPYFWANPGHSTQLGYEQMTNANQLVSAFDRLGITYVYINLSETFGHDGKEIARWQQAAGIGQQATPYTGEDRAHRMIDPQDKYKVLLAEAVAAGKLGVVKGYGASGARLIFVVAR